MIRTFLAIAFLAISSFAQTGTVHVEGGSLLGVRDHNISQLIPAFPAGATAVQLDINVEFKDALFSENNAPGVYWSQYDVVDIWKVSLGIQPSHIRNLGGYRGYNTPVTLNYVETNTWDGVWDFLGPTVHFAEQTQVAPTKRITITKAEFDAFGADIWFTGTFGRSLLQSYIPWNGQIHNYIRNHFYADITYTYLF